MNEEHVSTRFTSNVNEQDVSTQRTAMHPNASVDSESSDESYSGLLGPCGIPALASHGNTEQLQGMENEEVSWPLGGGDIRCTQLMAETGSNHSRSSELLENGENRENVTNTCTLFNNGAMSPWMNRFVIGTKPPIENDANDPKQCYICSDTIEPN